MSGIKPSKALAIDRHWNQASSGGTEYFPCALILRVLDGDTVATINSSRQRRAPLRTAATTRPKRHPIRRMTTVSFHYPLKAAENCGARPEFPLLIIRQELLGADKKPVSCTVVNLS
jgi:hypothetical protein